MSARTGFLGRAGRTAFAPGTANAGTRGVVRSRPGHMTVRRHAALVLLILAAAVVAMLVAR